MVIFQYFYYITKLLLLNFFSIILGGTSPFFILKKFKSEILFLPKKIQIAFLQSLCDRMEHFFFV